MFWKKLCAPVAIVMMLTSSVSVYADTIASITASALNVREEASSSSRLIGTLNYGDTVTVISGENGWYKIVYSDGTAFVSSKYVEPVGAAPAAAVQEGPVQGPATKGNTVLDYAKNFIGVPYVYGGNGPDSFDCSGFVKYVFAHFGVSLPRTSYSQMNVGTAVSADALKVGDLVFFRDGGHVGIYAGDGMYIHAPQTGRNVSLEPMNRAVCAARRIL